MLLVPAKKQVPTACSNPVLIHIYLNPSCLVLISPTVLIRSHGEIPHLFIYFYGGCPWVTRILFSGIAVVQLGGPGCADMIR